MAYYSFPGRYYILSFILCISFLCKCFAFALQQQNAHTVQLASLFPASICSHSSSVHEKEEATLKVVHKHGPCSSSPEVQDHGKILQQDEARVNSIRSRLRSGRAEKQVEGRGSGGGGGGAEVPAISGAVVGSGNYIVRLRLGTAKEELSMIFDTGSDVTWTQCKPCSKCYAQKEPLFDPSTSASYSNVSCTSSECASLKSSTGITPGCSSGTSTCIYGIQYGDKSFSVGYLAKDTLTLTSSAIFPGFLFGCGKNNQGLFGSAAGLLGLGRNKISFVEQTAAKYGRKFSYCLPATSSSSGYLSFGAAATNHLTGTIVYTPLSALPSLGESFYGVYVAGISVGGKMLNFPAENFNSGGTIVDSGTVITRMSPTAYSALSAEFKKQMSAYPKAPALSILDTCYNLSGNETVSVPKVVFFFGGKVAVSLAAQGVLYAVKPTQVCLAFAANGHDGDVSIIGNVQQRTLKVVYDIGAGKIGFGAGGCS